MKNIYLKPQNQNIKVRFFAFFILCTLFCLLSCEGFFGEGMSVTELKKENAKLQIQVDTLNRELGKTRNELLIKTMIIKLYTIRHALEKYAFDNKGEYPVASTLQEIQAAVSKYLPNQFEVDMNYLEGAKSSERGYILIATVKEQKIVVSNLIESSNIR